MTIPASDSILVTRQGHCVTIAINRPEARNSITIPTCLELHEKLSVVAADKEVGVVVFRGTGSDFCCGADLKGGNLGSGDGPAEPTSDIFDITLLLHEMHAVTVAAIRGGCAGAGLGWACACDLRVGAEDAVFNTAFLNVGVAGDMAVPWTLPRIIGSGRARDLSFFPRKVRGDEALRIGLLDRLWPVAKFEAELDAMVKELAAAAPLALAMMKANFVEAERIGLRSFLAIEGERHHRLLQTDDLREAGKARREKRPPQFHGR